MNLTAEQRAIGKANFELTRREFLEASVAAGLVSGAGLGAAYFGYQSLTDPVRVGVIGTGDEGGILIGAHTPEYVKVVAIADIRPYNIHRAFHGDNSSPAVKALRTGLMTKYGWQAEDEARKHVKVYDQDYHDLLKDPAVEAVIIALPLHLHDSVAIEAMEAGKHVLTEKLMAHSVNQCKSMSRVAHAKRLHLATGHQRHYSVLYGNAVQMIKKDVLGDLHHIRAQWHRGNLPGRDSWSPALPDKIRQDLEKAQADVSAMMAKNDPSLNGKIEAAQQKIKQWEMQVLDEVLASGEAKDAKNFGYQDKTLPGGYKVSALEELIRWRLWERTGGGLMAELGSHQLDASGIFCTAVRKDDQKALPLTVSAVGGRHIFPEDREVDDHVYCTYEYPNHDYNAEDPQLKNRKIVVTYSSINGNDFGGYGEIVMGTNGTLILEKEQEVMLYPRAGANTSITVTKKKGSDAPVLDTTQSGGSGPAVSAGKPADAGPISRGYTEEIEHFAYCIRNFDYENNKPKCHPKVALADAVIALTTNIAIRENRRIEFKPEWFDIASDETPEGVKPTIPVSTG